MPQVEIVIGGRSFEVACRDGEEPFLQRAAALLNEEATQLSSQIGRMPEARMLLMAGLMLADQYSALAQRLSEVEAALAERPEPVQVPVEVRVEVPTIPAAVTDHLAEIAARTEAIARRIEEQVDRANG